MKFSKKFEEIKNREENKGKIVLIRCGIFFIAIGNDAVLLNRLYGLKVTCFKENVCKVGIPVSFISKYLDILEEDGYSYILYDYDKNTKELIEKYKFEGKLNTEQENCKTCKECAHYKPSCAYGNINIDELLKKREASKEGQVKDEQ